MARKGAVENRFPDGDVEVINKLDITGAACLNRLMAVHEIIMDDEGKEPKKPKGTNLRDRVRELQRVGEANGHQIEHGRGVRCLRCSQKSAVKLAHRWVGEDCPGAGTENGHTTHVIHGVHVCSGCGKWAIPGRKRGPGLGKACNRKPTFHGRRIIRRMIEAHPPLPPYKMSRWPNGHMVENQAEPKEGQTNGERKRDRPAMEGVRRRKGGLQGARPPQRASEGGRGPAGYHDGAGPSGGTGSRPPGQSPNNGGGRVFQEGPEPEPTDPRGGTGRPPGHRPVRRIGGETRDGPDQLPPDRSVSRLDAVRNRILNRIREGGGA